MSEQLAQMFLAARNGDGDACGRLLEHYRPWMKLIAQRRMDGAVALRMDASDLVQQTCLSIIRHLDQIGGENLEEFRKWLRMVHERNIANALRDHVGAACRSVRREAAVPSDADLISSAPSPTQRALENERAVALAKALEGLPEDQREAVRLRYLEGFLVREVADRMGRSTDAVVGLLRRGLERLRVLLPGDA
jgi:RNA polymerase sigma-70 factor, ECF subfamily